MSTTSYLRRYRNTIPMLITFISAVIAIAAYYFPVSQTTTSFSAILDTVAVMGPPILLVGFTRLMLLQIRRIRARSHEWYLNGMTMFSAVVMFISTFFLGGTHAISNWLFYTLIYHINATVFALLGFAMINLAYHSCRIKGWESGFFGVAVIIAVFSSLPMAELVPGGSAVLAVNKWLIQYINTTALRAFVMTAAIGAIAIGVRIILGMQWISGEGEE